MDPQRRRMVLGVVAIAALSAPALVDFVVYTDEEAIEDLVETLARSVEQQDGDALLECLAPDFRSGVRVMRAGDREAVRERLPRIFRSWKEARVVVDSLEVEVEGDLASVAAQGVLLVRLVEGPLPQHFQARAKLRRGIEGWRFTELEQLDLRPGVF